MQDVLNFISAEVRIEEFIGVRHERANNPEELQKEESRVKDMRATLDKMSYKELKAFAGVKGNIKREKIYELIHLSK
jgi:hypothetical protein